jgi:hypothetical protein
MFKAPEVNQNPTHRAWGYESTKTHESWQGGLAPPNMTHAWGSGGLKRGLDHIFQEGLWSGDPQV